MPRVSIKKKQYKMNDFIAFVYIKMKEKKISQSKMATELGISQSAFSQRLKSNYFTIADLITILEILDATDTEILKIMK